MMGECMWSHFTVGARDNQTIVCWKPLPTSRRAHRIDAAQMLRDRAVAARAVVVAEEVVETAAPVPVAPESTSGSASAVSHTVSSSRSYLGQAALLLATHRQQKRVTSVVVTKMGQSKTACITTRTRNGNCQQRHSHKVGGRRCFGW